MMHPPALTYFVVHHSAVVSSVSNCKLLAKFNAEYMVLSTEEEMPFSSLLFSPYENRRFNDAMINTKLLTKIIFDVTILNLGKQTYFAFWFCMNNRNIEAKQLNNLSTFSNDIELLNEPFFFKSGFSFAIKHFWIFSFIKN